MQKCCHLFIKGKVQGVFFRASTQQKAQKLNLTGWVKNLPNGQVEVVAEGNSRNLKTFLKWIQKGPQLAHITSIDIYWEKPLNKFNSFSIKY